MKKNKLIFAAVIIAYTAYYFLRKNFSVAIPYLQDQISQDKLGLIMSAVSLAYGFSNLLMGFLTDYINPKKFLVFGLLISVLANLVFGFSPLEDYEITMFILMFINGLAQGIGYPTSSKIITNYAQTNKQQNTVITLWSMGQNIGGGLMSPLATLGTLLISLLNISIISSYKGIFIFPAIICLILTCICLMFIYISRDKGGLSKELSNETQKFSMKQVRQNMFDLMKDNIFILLLFINIIAYFIRYAILDWSPTILHHNKHMNSNYASILYMLYEWSGIIGTFIFSILIKKYKSQWHPLITVIFIVLILISTSLYFYTNFDNKLLDSLIFILIGMLIYGPLLYVNVETMNTLLSQYIGAAIGILGFGGNVIGAFSANAAVGYLMSFSFHYMCLFILLLEVIGILLCFILFRKKQSSYST
ncbi:MFS transporter [Staphylococcus gallinarum]|uniref:Glycerol-3-phosphate transporter n=1 Tax=Staphylococcus gallinarum TaxID=1293 RepID=A0A0D0SFQ3_STAGA|nr:MFS transporter [Staphylococcus gallinarum]KIR11075.1 hypothetical protein SH09_09625 [Staphylococcus gallinarum]RTX80297.1 MFS transporter [Staphylococcus gallinarum]GEQ06582.1 glycerol-3-phosphate transporter [Staphylococcus gallinarum]SUQ38614.1 glycerol-3-phosphate transporter [Staphylococcus gallinarum]